MIIILVAVIVLTFVLTARALVMDYRNDRERDRRPAIREAVRRRRECAICREAREADPVALSKDENLTFAEIARKESA